MQFQSDSNCLRKEKPSENAIKITVLLKSFFFFHPDKIMNFISGYLAFLLRNIEFVGENKRKKNKSLIKKKKTSKLVLSRS